MMALLLAAPAWALTTGQLRVTVVDDVDQFPLPTATVSLTGDTLIGGLQERVTDANGQALFVELPPGTYALTVIKAGFAGRTVQGLQINVNRTATQTVELPLEGGEEIVVEATRDVIETESTSRGQVLTKEFLQRIPAGRSYQTAVQMASGVVGDGGNPNMAGGASDENTYLLDGANITDPVTGTFSVNFNFDAIQQIEVLLGGYMPEYGVSVGGIINIVTESGTNNLEFDSGIFYNNGNLRPRLDERLTADGVPLAPTDFDSDFELIYVTSKISGPIVRDRAWFIVSYQQSRSIIAATGSPQARDFQGQYFLAKVTVQPSTEHRLTSFLQMDPTNIDNRVQGNPFVKAEAQNRQVQGGFISQVRWQWFLSPELNIDTQFMTQKSYIESNGVPCTHNRDRAWHPCKPGELEGEVDFETPGRVGVGGAFDSGNWGLYDFDDRWRYQASTKVSVVSIEDPLGGTHDFKFGVEGQQLVHDRLLGYSGNTLFVDINEVPFDPGTFLNYYWLEYTGPVKYRTTASQFNTFAQDSWKPVSNLTINYGTRFDQYVLRNDLGEPVLRGGLLGPRLFAAWDPWGDQRTKVATGYGRFNDTGTLGVASFTSASSFGSKLYFGEFFSGDADSGVGFLNNSSLLFDIDPATNFNTAHDNLRTPSVDELILTLEREIIEDMAAFSSMSGKFTRHMYEPDELSVIYDSDGSTEIGSRLANSDENRFRLRTPKEARRDYFQWDLGVRKVESRRWAAQATYTYTQSVGTSPFSQSGSFANDPQTQYNYGPFLNTDIRHVVKAFGFWDLPTDPWKQTIGVFFDFRSGFPFERLYHGERGASGAGGSYFVRINERGVYSRFNSVWSVSLKFTQDIDVRKGKIVLDFEAQNVLNNRAPNNLFTNLFSTNRVLTATRQDPLRLQFGVRYEF